MPAPSATPAPQPTQPTLAVLAARLSVAQRVLLFCLASNTDWQKAGIAAPTVQRSILHSLIKRDEVTSHLELTERGSAVFGVLLGGG